MNRKRKLLLNSVFGVMKQLVVTICGFILPRYMIMYYGSSINGLVSSIAHFLSFISLLEMGIGPVIQSNLYKPLADKDNEQISKIVISSEKFFRRIAFIFLMYILVLLFVFPTFINTEYDFIFTASLIVIISISTFAQYYFGATYQLLLNADQKAYIQIALQMITVILNTVFSIVLMNFGASIQAVKLLTAGIYVLRPLGQMIYVRKHYSINKKLILYEEPIKQKWYGFSQHLAAVICSNIDVVLLTFLSTLGNISIYSVYFNVINGVTSIIMIAATGFESFFGNILAKKEDRVLVKSFETLEWIMHAGVTVIFTITMITIVPFIKVYTEGINDIDYIKPLFACVLTLAYAAQCLRVPYFRLIKAAGHFKETQNGAYISALLNVVVSLVLIFKYDLVGIALGTLVAMLYHTIYFVWYLRKNILNRSAGYFIKHIVIDIVILILAVMITKGIEFNGITYLAWFVYAFKVGIITLLITVIVNVFGNYNLLRKVLKK